MAAGAIQLNENKGIQFSLSFLLQVIATIVLAVWGYSQLDGRISIVESGSAANSIMILRIETDIKESQDAPIPSDHIQNTTLFAHEQALSELRSRLLLVEARLYERRDQ